MTITNTRNSRQKSGYFSDAAVHLTVFTMTSSLVTLVAL